MSFSYSTPGDAIICEQLLKRKLDRRRALQLKPVRNPWPVFDPAPDITIINVISLIAGVWRLASGVWRRCRP